MHPENTASEYFKLQIFWTTERRRVLNSTTFIASQYGHKYGKKWLASWKVYWQSRIRTEMSITKTHNLNKLFTKTYHIWNFIMPSLEDIPFFCISVLSTLIILISTKLSSAFALDSIFIVLVHIHTAEIRVTELCFCTSFYVHCANVLHIHSVKTKQKITMKPNQTKSW